jgi:hypothetical protein
VLPKYFHSEWSVAQFRLHEGEQYIVAFGHEKNTVAVVGMDGRYGQYFSDVVCIYGFEIDNLLFMILQLLQMPV